MCPISRMGLAIYLDPDQTPLYDDWFGLGCSLLNRNFVIRNTGTNWSVKGVAMQCNKYLNTRHYHMMPRKQIVPIKQRDSYVYHGSHGTCRLRPKHVYDIPFKCHMITRKCICALVVPNSSTRWCVRYDARQSLASYLSPRLLVEFIDR